MGAVASALLDVPLWRQRLAHLARRDDLDGTTRERLACLATLHDLGKLNLGFQAKGRPELGPTAGHVLEALGAIDRGVFRCVEPLDDWGEAALPLLVAAVRHHGRPKAFDQASAGSPAHAGMDPLSELSGDNAGP